MRQNFVVPYQVEFMKDCGMEGRCESDMELRATFPELKTQVFPVL